MDEDSSTLKPVTDSSLKPSTSLLSISSTISTKSGKTSKSSWTSSLPVLGKKDKKFDTSSLKSDGKKNKKGKKGKFSRLIKRFKKNTDAPAVIVESSTHDIRRIVQRAERKEDDDVTTNEQDKQQEAVKIVDRPADYSVANTLSKVKKKSVSDSYYEGPVLDDDEQDLIVEGEPEDIQEEEIIEKKEISSVEASIPNVTVTSSDEPSSPEASSAPPIQFDKKTPSDIKNDILSSTLPRQRKTSVINGNSTPNGNEKIITRETIFNMDKSSKDKNELLFKLLVIGELGTGKTSLIKRYVHQFFSQHYRATIGVDFALKVLQWDGDTVIRLQLWDIAGQERFGNMTRVYYKEAVGAFIVFDVTRAATFDAITKWKQDLDSKVQLPDGSPIPCILLANKCDQPKEGIVNNSSKMDEYCKENQFVAWFETSAKENINVDEAAKCLVTKIIENDKKSKENDGTNGSGIVSLEKENGDESNGKKCSC